MYIKGIIYVLKFQRTMSKGSRNTPYTKIVRVDGEMGLGSKLHYSSRNCDRNFRPSRLKFSGNSMRGNLFCTRGKGVQLYTEDFRVEQGLLELFSATPNLNLREHLGLIDIIKMKKT